jgi:mRNA interferase MazF
VRRGDVFELRAPRGTGHEQRGKRYGVVVQSDALLPSSVVLVAPTSRSARRLTYRPNIRVADQSTMVMIEQMTAVDGTRLGKLVGHATPEEMWGIDEAILTVFGLS